MHKHPIEQWAQDHSFGGQNETAEKRTRWVMWLTAVTMVVEIVAGTLFGSMALLADGWHMGTHVAAFGIAMFAYAYARRHSDNPRFSFGTGKVSVLGGFASAVTLAVVALFMVVESASRLLQPAAIHFDQAIFVACLGLAVNLLSAAMLHGAHHHHHHDHGEAHHHHHHDHNLKAAYMHVLADALTSVLAIIALLSGKYFGWNWLDPVMGLVGAAIILRWSYGLLRETSELLLDSGVEEAMRQRIRASIEADADNEIADLHVWHPGPNRMAAVISIVTHHPRPPEHYKALLADIHDLIHVTVEVNVCAGNCFGEEGSDSAR